MMLAPIAENSEEAIVQLGRDLERAYRHNIEQILIPANIPNLHWYTIQLQLLKFQGGCSLEAIVHDSLGIRKSSVIVEKLVAQGIEVTKQMEGSLPKIQGGEFGAKNVYCGGYTARLITNLALDSRIMNEMAWGCPNNIDNILRQEDAKVVAEHNADNAVNFGKASVASRKMLDSAQDMSLLRSFIAKEKEINLLKEFEAIYETIPIEIKIRIQSLNIPEDPAELSALVRDLYTGLPILKALLKTDEQGEIEKDAEGILKLDTTVEIEQIHKIMVEFQRKCLGLEGIVVEANSPEAEPHGSADSKDGSSDVVTPLNAVDAAGQGSRGKKKDIEYYELDLKEKQARYSGNHPETANSLYNLGLVYMNSGYIEKSLAYLKPALEMRQSFYQGDKADLANSFYSVGFAYYSLGDYRKAYDCYRLALVIRGSLYKGNNAELATSLYSMGSIYYCLGCSKKSLDHHMFALNMRQLLYRGDNAETAASLSSVGAAYQKLEDSKKALHYHKLALKMNQSLYPGNNADVANSLHAVGFAHQKLGNIRQALYYYEFALKMRQSLYKDDHHDIANSFYSVGFMYRNLEDHKKALDYYELALKMKQSLCKGDHPDVVVYLNTVGATYQKLEEYNKSISYLESALKMAQSLYKTIRFEIALSLQFLGIAYHKLGSSRQALGYLEPALNMYQSLYKGNHAEIATTLIFIGSSYHTLGDSMKALAYKESSLKMRQSLYKGDHHEIATSLSSMGIVLQSLGCNRKALDYLEQALKMNQAVYKGDHYEVANSLYNAGVLRHSLGDDWEALVHLEQALKMKQSLYGGIHPEVANSLYNLGVVHRSLGYIGKAFHYYELALNMRQLFYSSDHPDVVASFKAVCITGEKLAEIKRHIDYQEYVMSFERRLNKPEQKAKFKGRGTLFKEQVSYAAYSYLEYYNSAIDQILKLRLDGLKHNANTVLLKSRYFGRAIGFTAEKLAYDVTVAFSDGNTQIVLAPINLHNKHWLGLLFKRLETMVEVTYLDSEQGTMSYDLRAGLEKGLAKSRFLEVKLEQQRYNNCGPELLENFVYYLTGTRATQEGAVYVHSLLVENSLLNPKEYALKIAENNKLLGFLSNAQAVKIMELAFPTEQVFEARLTITDLNKKKKLDVTVINSMLHQASVWFKALDLVVDSARLAQEPTIIQAKKLVLDYAYLQGMVSGVNSYSVMIGVAETMYQLQLGEYRAAFTVAAGTVSAMALPVILAMANRPYLGIAYGAWIATSTAYGAITNAYSFAHELGSDDAVFRSAMAYKDLAEALAISPLQSFYDFGDSVKGYKLQINDLLFEKEKTIVEAKMKGEFGQKVFDYIYLPMLFEKYSLMNDVIRGMLTEEEAQGLKTKHITITSQSQSYEHCMELRGEAGVKSGSEYYCYNMAEQVLDRVELTTDSSIIVIEHL